MAHLNDEHIAYIRKDLHFRGIVLEGIEDELLDHICCSVESEMDNGLRFIDAYDKTLHSFGHGSGLRTLQKSAVKEEQKDRVMMLGHYIKIALRNSGKYALFTFINVAGLAPGVAACFMISLLITVEWWLNDYNYRIEVGWYVYPGAGLFAITIAWLTTGIQSIRSALANPAESLRSE